MIKNEKNLALLAGRDKKFIPQSLRSELILLPQDN
jgi:hypothetical protein